MGLSALRKIIPPTPCELAFARGRTVAVDADNLLWSFVTALGARGEPPLSPEGRPISHLIGLSNRLKLYADHGIASAWIFDGEQPALKEATLAGRWARIEEARAQGNTAGGLALEAGEIAEAKALLTALGIPWMEAPGESDAQCAQLAREGAAWAAITQDYDAALHASPRTLRNFSGSPSAKPEMLDLEAALAGAGLTREMLVDVAILIGTDYNEGVPGVGPVKAVKLVKSEGTLAGALKRLGVEIANADAIQRLFLEHPVARGVPLDFRAPDASRVARQFADSGISSKRAETLVEAVAKLHGDRGD